MADYRGRDWRCGSRAAGLTLALVLLLTSSMVLAQAWTGRHGDTGRTGRSAGTGDITRPSVAWQVPIGSEVPGARVLVEDVNGDGELEYLTMVDGAVVARNFDDVVLWDSPPLGVSSFSEVADLDGDDRPEIILIGRLAVILDGETGQVLWRRVPDNPASLSFRAGTVRAVNVDSDPEKELFFAAGDKIAELYDFSQGFDVAPSWTNTDTAMPTAVVRPIIGDFDANPNTNEVALVNQSFCQILFISLDTGETLRITASLTEGLFCYGLYQATNVDDDPQDEIIFTGSIGASRGSVSLTVYDYVDDSTQWQYEFANNNTALTTLSPAGAVADLDGDGQKEAFMAVYNNGAESGGADDGIAFADQWSVGIYDASSGEPLGSLANRTVVGFADVDHDGTPELITRSGTEGTTALPATGTIELWTLDGQRSPELRWQIDGVAPVLQTLPVGPEVTSRDFNALPALFDLGGNGEPKLLVARGDNDGEVTTVQALSFGNDVSVDAQVQIAGGNGVSLIQTGEGLLDDGPHVVLRSTQGRFRVYNSQLSGVDSLSLAGHISPIVAVKLRQGTALQTIHRDASGALVALDPTNANPLQAPEELWSRPTNGGDFMAFDRDSDGLYEVVFASTNDDGVPFIEMVDSQGTTLWNQALENARFAPFALTFGQFGGQGDSIDVAGITFLEDSTAITWTFDGVDGSIMASHTAAAEDVNPNPNRDLMAIGDRNNDGNDDLLLLHFTTLEELSGADLTRIGDVVAFPPQNANPINNTVIVTEDRVDAYIKAFRSQLYTINVETGVTNWTSDLPASLNSYASNFAGYSDADGDGRIDVAVPGFLGDLTLHSGATGDVLWRMCLDGGQVRPLAEPATLESCQPIAPVSAVVTADIDGDNDEDFIVGDSAGFVYALDVATGAVTWSADLTARARFLTLADLDGDGQLEIAATTSRSELIVVDHAAITPTDEVRDVALDNQNQIVDADTDIAQTNRTDALGMAWEAAPRADAYLVSLRTENNTEVVGRTNVGDVTEHVFEGLSLVPGTTYIVSVVAISDGLGAAPAVDSNGVLVVGAAPQIIGLNAEPNPLTQNIGESAEITALVSADGVIPLTNVTLQITADDDTVVAEQIAAPGVSNFNLNFTWDGTDQNDQPVASGEYQITVTAQDALGGTVEDTISLTVREPGDPLISAFVADPETFNPGAGQTTTLTGVVAADAAVSLQEVSVRISDADDNTLFEEIYAPGANSFSVRTIWDGTDTSDVLVEEGEYTAQLSATDTLGNNSTSSITVTVVPPGAPTINDFAATPDNFDPAAGQSTELTAQVVGTGPIEDAILTIRGEDNATVFEEAFAPDADTFSLRTSWDGRSEGDLVAPGDYTATLVVTDVFDNLTEAAITIVVVPPGETFISNFAADPDTFDAGLGEQTTLSATVSAGNMGLLDSVTLQIRTADDTQVYEQSFEPGASSFALQTTWDGRDLAGELVAAGDFTATLTATNTFGSEATQDLLLTVLVTEEPEEDTGTPDMGTPDVGTPDVGTPDAGNEDEDVAPPNVEGPGDNCTCTTPAAPTRQLPASAWFIAALGLALVLRRRV